MGIEELACRACARVGGSLAVLLVGAAVLFGGALEARAHFDDGKAPSRPHQDWFHIDETAAKSWRINEDHDDQNVVEVVHRDTKGDFDRPLHEVLVLYPKPSSAYDIAISKILTMFATRKINARFTVMNFRRDDALGHAALDLAHARGAGLIFGMGSQSTAWLWENFRGGDIPVVSVTSKDPVMLGQADSYDRGTGTNFAFTSLNMPIEAQLAYVFQLRPNLQNLAVLVDANNVSAVETQARPMIEAGLARGIQVLNLEVRNPDEARSELASLVSDAVSTMRKNDINLENSLFWITGSTSVFREIATINANADRVPVLSVVPDVVKDGDDSAALSIGIGFESNAHLAAIYAIKVLEGESNVGSLPVGVVSPPDIAINFRKAREIGLSVPFSFVEGATFIYDYNGKAVRYQGVNLVNR